MTITNDPQHLEVVVADNLDSKVSLWWPRFRSSIDGFETINKAAPGITSAIPSTSDATPS